MNKLKLTIITWCILLLFSILTIFSACSGQNTTQVVNNDLISQNSIVATGDTVSELGKSILIIFQSANGNYWFGSDVDGVYRYDGKNIIHFSTKHGLCNNTIREIKEDTSGNIFFSTQHGGISKFDGQKFTALPVSKSSSPEKDWKLEPNDLWFKGETGKNGPYRYDGKTLYHLVFPKHFLADTYYAQFPDNSWSPYEVYFIYKDRAGNMWFGTSNFGICRYDGKTLSWMYEKELTEIEGGGSFGIRSIIEDKAGKFWFCNTRYRYEVFPGDSISQGNSLIKYRKETGVDLSKANNETDFTYFMSVAEDKKGQLWMATYNSGVWQFDGEKITRYPVKEGNTNITIYSIYQDHQDVLWLGTHEAGAYKFNGKTFEKFNP